MNFKKLMAGVLGTGLAVSLGVNSTTAYADEGIKDEAKLTDNSEAKVNFAGGILTLGTVTGIDFGSSKIEEDHIGADGNYTFSTGGLSLVVKDMRGTGEGWHLTAKADAFKDEESNTSLKGAEITLKNGKAFPRDEFDSVPAPSIVTGEEGLVLSDKADTVVNANSEDTFSTSEGTGIWTIDWSGENDVELRVPAKSASVGKHTATITWTLENGPDTDGE